MRHFGHLGEEIRRQLFLVEPAPFDRHSAAGTLSVALGATLYSPATRLSLADDIRKQAARGVVSMVLCLEDAIGDQEVEAAELNLVGQLRSLVEPTDHAALPLLFVRVRAPARSATWSGGWARPSPC